MGSKRHCCPVSTLSEKYQANWVLVTRKIHQWIYSWMKPGYVRDEDEYKISKFILLQFVCSAQVLAAAEGHVFMIIRMIRWLHFHMFTYESLYLYFLRKKIRTNFTAHGSVHEVRLIFMHFFFLI